jgi:hypothetical protein
MTARRYSSSTRLPATQPNSLDVGDYGERKLPTTTSSPSDPAAQPKSVSWVMLCPLLTEERSPLAVLPPPPLIEAKSPLAVLSIPPLTEASKPLAVLQHPPLIEDLKPLALLKAPPTN